MWGKKQRTQKTVHSSVQKPPEGLAAATGLFRSFQSTIVLGRNEYWNASTFAAIILFRSFHQQLSWEGMSIGTLPHLESVVDTLVGFLAQVALSVLWDLD